MTRSLTLGLFHTGEELSKSGIPFHLIRALQQIEQVRLVRISSPPYRPSLIKRIRKKAHRTVTGKQYLWEKEADRCKHFSRAIDRAAAEGSPDAILMIFESELCAYTRTRLPIFCYSDSMFGSRLDFYSDQITSQLDPRSIEEGIRVQQMALERLSAIFLSSRWAWNQAMQRFHYRAPEEKCEVVSIGANLPESPPLLPPRPSDSPLVFTWIGLDWKRKGGDFAVQTIEELRRLGFVARLEIIGRAGAQEFPSYVTMHGRLSYSAAADYARLLDIFRRSTALLLPTTADLTPIAIAEAAAFGRPAIATRVGGIPEMINDGRTGLLLPLTTPNEWAARIAEALGTNAFHRMAADCRQNYESRLNWEAVARRIVTRIDDCVIPSEARDLRLDLPGS